MVDPPDTELVATAQSGDRAALDALLRAHQPRIYSICRRMTGSDADALDATQEALIAVVRGLPRFDGRSKFSTWVFRVATNACLDELRRRKRRAAEPLPEYQRADDRSVTLPGRDGPRLDEALASRIDIDEALAQLPTDFRAAVVLRDLCRLDYAEIAEVLDIPPGTVRSRISRGRSSLAQALDPGNQRSASARRTDPS